MCGRGNALRFAFLLILSNLVTGCETWSTAKTWQNDEQKVMTQLREPEALRRPAHSILVYEGDIKGRRYVALGDIEVTVRRYPFSKVTPTRDLVRAALQRKAADMGANALIHVRYSRVGSDALSRRIMQGRARAIRF